MTTHQATKQLEAGVPIDPVLIINGTLSLIDIVANLFAKRTMLKARVTALEALLVTVIAVNAKQDERLNAIESNN